MKRFLPKSLAGQLVLWLVLTLFAAQLAVLALSANDRLRVVASVEARQTLETASSLLRLMADREPRDWPLMIHAFENRDLDIRLEDQRLAQDRGHNGQNAMVKRLSRRLPAGFGPAFIDFESVRFFSPEHWQRSSDDEEQQYRRHFGRRAQMIATIDLPDGRFLNMRRHIRPPPVWAGIAWGYFLFSAVLISAVAYLAMRRLTRPLRELARAAEQFGRGGAVPELPLKGPSELQKAAQAFNEMASRIGRFVSDRTAMIAAISHDLPTPITSLRLHSEFVEDRETREKMQAALDEMTAMTEATLAFARDDAKDEAMQPLDLKATLESLADDQRDLGRQVDVAGMERNIIQARPTALRRALRNLLDNALRYGDAATISLVQSAKETEIRIDDNGPGIPANELERVFEPFTRLETSRNLKTGGTGLGLAIARTILRGHGGDIRLLNLKNGLRASVTLPRQ